MRKGREGRKVPYIRDPQLLRDVIRAKALDPSGCIYGLCALGDMDDHGGAYAQQPHNIYYDANLRMVEVKCVCGNVYGLLYDGGYVITEMTDEE